MDRFELRRVANEHASSPKYDAIEILINGTPLLDTVRPLEEQYVAAEIAQLTELERQETDSFLTAGQYMYPTAICFEKEPWFFGTIEREFVVTPADPKHGKVILFGCDCGVVGCWPFLARIETHGDTVRWSDFEQFHADWDYELGPFRFPRDAYEAELHRVVAAKSA